MSVSLSILRRGLLGIAVVASLGFGAVQALATPELAQRSGSCLRTGYAYIPSGDECADCPSGGYCDGWNTECVCYDFGL